MRLAHLEFASASPMQREINEGRDKMRITKRQLKRIIREEKSKLNAGSNQMRRLRRLVREQMGAPPEEDERAAASVSALKDWFRDKLADMPDVPGAQVPALIASMEDMIETAAAGKLKSKEAQMSRHISKLGGLGEADDEGIGMIAPK